MQQSSKPARIPSYWFGWYPKQMPTEFYVLVYREVRKQRVRKSNKPRVMQIMRQIDICHRNATHNMTLIKESNMSDLTKTVVDSQLNEFGIETKKPVEPTPVEITKPHSEGQLDLEIPSFLDRRKTTVKTYDTRQKHWTPKTSRHAPENWQKDAVLAKLDEMRQNYWECHSGASDAIIDRKNFDGMISLLATDLGNALEQAGLIYMSEGSAGRLKELLGSWVMADTKYANGSMYRYVCVAEEYNGEKAKAKAD